MKRLLIALFFLAAASPAVASDCWNNVAGTQTNCAEVPAFLNGSNQTVPVSAVNPLPVTSSGGGGASSSFGAAFPATGTAAGAEYLSSPPTLTTGQMVAFQTDINGKLLVIANGGTNLNTSALALETGGNLATLTSTTGAITDGTWSGTGNSTVTQTQRAIYSAIVAPITPCTNASCSNGNPVGGVLSETLSGVVTTPIASPGVVNWTAHGLAVNQAVVFSGAALPTGLTAGTTYFVISAGLTTNAFEVAATQGGAAINFTGSSSGVQTATALQSGPLGQALTLTSPPAWSAGSPNPLVSDLGGNLHVTNGSWMAVPGATLTVTTASHAPGTVVGITNTNQPIQFTKGNNGGGAGDAGEIHNISITSKAVVTVGLKAYIFTTLPATTFTDAAVPGLGSSDILKTLDVIYLDPPDSSLGTMTVWKKSGLTTRIAGNGSFWLLLVTTGSASFTPATTTDFQAKITGAY